MLSPPGLTECLVLLACQYLPVGSCLVASAWPPSGPYRDPFAASYHAPAVLQNTVCRPLIESCAKHQGNGACGRSELGEERAEQHLSQPALLRKKSQENLLSSWVRQNLSRPQKHCWSLSASTGTNPV